MNDKRADHPLTVKWLPIAAGAVTAGIVVGQTSGRLGLVFAAAVALIGGLAVFGVVYAVLKQLVQRRS